MKITFYNYNHRFHITSNGTSPFMRKYFTYMTSGMLDSFLDTFSSESSALTFLVVFFASFLLASLSSASRSFSSTFLFEFQFFIIPITKAIKSGMLSIAYPKNKPKYPPAFPENTSNLILRYSR